MNFYKGNQVNEDGGIWHPFLLFSPSQLFQKNCRTLREDIENHTWQKLGDKRSLSEGNEVIDTWFALNGDACILSCLCIRLHQC